jgi:predicted PurR-regulated permease PerM
MNKISVSPSIIWWASGIILGFWFLYAIREVIVLFFIALLISAGMNPAIRRICAKGVSRILAVSLVFSFVFAFSLGMLSFIIPKIISEATSFARSFPVYMQELTGSDAFSHTISNYFLSFFNGNAESFRGISENIFSTTVGVFDFMIAIVAVFVIAFYLSIKEDGVGSFLKYIVPKKYQDFVVSRAKIVYEKIGRWMIGQLLIMFVVFLLYYAVLLAFGVPNAFIIALFGGLLEIVPLFGPLIAAIPAVAVAFFVSPLVGFSVLLCYLIIQQVQNYVILPQIMKKALGLNPIVIILALLVGAKIAGISGMILAVPFAMGVRVFIHDILDARQEKSPLPQKV